MDEKTPTYGGYSTQIVATEDFVLRLPSNIELARVAPLLCAGITTYSPLKHWKVGPGVRVGVIGLGGLGHMAVQIASRMGADVTVFSTSKDKEADARRLGANHFVVARTEEDLAWLVRSCHFVLSTVSSAYVLKQYINVLEVDGTMCVVGLPPANQAPALDLMSLVSLRRNLAGSMIGGIAETQEMLDFCGQHGIGAEIELIDIKDVNKAYDRVLASDVKYRFVIDLASLKS